MELRIEKYKDTYWAVYDGEELVCVTVYKKGAVGVVEKIKSLFSNASFN
ncbi:hypothetical protein RI065_08105 [Mycoplasmatota bacterium zrk1]